MVLLSVYSLKSFIFLIFARKKTSGFIENCFSFFIFFAQKCWNSDSNIIRHISISVRLLTSFYRGQFSLVLN